MLCRGCRRTCMAIAVIVFIDPHYVESGHVLTMVLGTGITTLLAHVVVDSQEHRVLNDGEEACG